MLDAKQVQKKVFSTAETKLMVTVVGLSTTNGTNLSAEQVWKKIYDPVTNTIRVASV